MEDFHQDAGFSTELDIIYLFGKEKLENIQKSLSKATGLAFVTVDYRGEPVTESTCFSSFCQIAREDPVLSLRCKSSDAFGAIQAAVQQKPCVYFCPCGLLEVAIPIVVKGHYLGGFIGGQIKCSDAPEEIGRLEKVMPAVSLGDLMKDREELFAQIPEYSYEKFTDIVNLVFLIINQLSENEIHQQLKWDTMKRRVEKVQDLNQKYRKENEKKDLQLLEMRASLDPYSMIDTLVSLVNLTVIEHAVKTGEMLTLFTDYMKYAFRKKSTFSDVSRELEHVERYLKIQKMKLGGQLSYSIQLPKNMGMQKIPSDIILPFVQSAVYYGVMLKKEGGEVNIRGYLNSGRCVIEVEDTGPGLSEEQLRISFEQLKDRHEGYYINMGMENACMKMQKIFGDDMDIATEADKGNGRRTLICWPEHFSERT